MTAVLDWSTHRAGASRRCRICNQHTILRDEGSSPCHKACAEREADPSAPPEPAPQLVAKPTPGPCSRPDCTTPATSAVRGKYDRSWFRVCTKHLGPVRDALYIGQPGDSGVVHVVKIPKEAAR